MCCKNITKGSGVVTSLGFPVGGERSYYIEGESQGGGETKCRGGDDWIGSKNNDENNGHSSRGNEALRGVEGNDKVGECWGGAEWG